MFVLPTRFWVLENVVTWPTSFEKAESVERTSWPLLPPVIWKSPYSWGESSTSVLLSAPPSKAVTFEGVWSAVVNVRTSSPAPPLTFVTTRLIGA